MVKTRFWKAAVLAVVVVVVAGCSSRRKKRRIFQPLQIVTTSIPDATEGVAYSYTLTATGGDASNYSWSISGQPSWLTIDASTGELSGTPPTGSAGKYTFTVSLTDGIGTVQTDFTLTVNSSSFQITTSSLPDGVEGKPYSAQLEATGGATPYTWSCVSGDLSAIGLSLDGKTGEITGTLSSGTAGSTYTFTFEVEDANGAIATKDFEIAVYALLEIVTSGLQDGVLNKAYSVTLQATGGKAPYTWGEVTGDPDGDGYDLADFGLTLNTDGTITGTPSKAGQVTFRAKVVDSANPQQEATKDLTINIKASTWTVQVVDPNVSAAYCSMVVDSSDHVHIVYQDMVNTTLKYAYYDGTSWRTETVYSTGNTGYYARIAADSNGTPHIFWYDKTTGKVMYAFWNGTAGIWDDKGFPPTACPDKPDLAIVVDGNDNPHLFCVDGTNLLHIYYDGASWQTDIVHTASHAWMPWTVAATIDANGNIWLTGTIYWEGFIGNNFQRRQTFKLWRTNAASSWVWTEVATLEDVIYHYSRDPADCGKFATFAFKVGVSSPYVVAWYEDGGEIRVYGDPNGLGYSYLYAIQTNVNDGNFCKSLFDSSGLQHAIWFNDTTTKVQYAKKQGINWVSEEVDNCNCDTSIDMAIDSADNLYVVYSDLSGLKVAIR